MNIADFRNLRNLPDKGDEHAAGDGFYEVRVLKTQGPRSLSFLGRKARKFVFSASLHPSLIPYVLSLARFGTHDPRNISRYEKQYVIRPTI